MYKKWEWGPRGTKGWGLRVPGVRDVKTICSVEKRQRVYSSWSMKPKALRKIGKFCMDRDGHKKRELKRDPLTR